MLVVFRTLLFFALRARRRALTRSLTLRRLVRRRALAVLAALFFLGLHALDNFLFLRVVAERLEEVDDLTVRILSFLQCILDPAVRFTAHIEEEIALGNLCDIFGVRLVAVQIDALVKKERDIRILCLVAENLTHPIVLREDGRDNL